MNENRPVSWDATVEKPEETRVCGEVFRPGAHSVGVCRGEKASGDGRRGPGARPLNRGAD
ncbi:unnamed protein product, partial [Nesidiocoris tenuis]